MATDKAPVTQKDAWGTIALVVIVAVCAFIWYQTHDFALGLVILTAVFIVVWVVDKLVFARRRRARAAAADAPAHTPLLVDYAWSFFPVLLAVLIFRSFIIEPFRIPSGSMMPTLLVGDFVAVNKFAYGLRLPVTNTLILKTGEPHRGDIAVFRYPGYTCHLPGGREVRGGNLECSTPVPKEDYIKRIVGLPGDVVEVKNVVIDGATVTQVSVNGKPMPEAFDGLYQGTDKVSVAMEENPGMSPVREYTEDLAGVHHHVLHFANPEPYYCRHSGGSLLPSGDGCKWIVPKDSYFAMGDNRDDSADSRYWGFVPQKNLAGKAFFIWFSMADWPHGLRRIGTVL